MDNQTFQAMALGGDPQLSREIAELEERLRRLRARLAEPATSAVAAAWRAPVVCAVPCAVLWELDS